MRRLFWIAVGLGFGVAAAVVAMRKIEEARARLSPPNLAREASSRVGEAAQGMAERVAEALDEGRRAMEEREAELRAQLGLDHPGAL